jgi:hypothetical protein
MAPRDLFEIGFSYVQYLLLLIQIAPSAFPSYYNVPFNVLRYLNLDLVNVFSEGARYSNSFQWEIPRWIPLDFRLQFTLVSVTIPLLASLIGMYSLAAKSFFLWYFCMLISLFLVVLGALLLLNGSMFASSVNESQRFYILYFGAIAAGLLGAFGLLRFVYLRLTEHTVDDADVLHANRQHGDVLGELLKGEDPAGNILEAVFGDGMTGDELSQATKNENLNQILERETAKVDASAAVERFAYVIVTLFFGLSFLGLFSSFIPPFENFRDSDFWWYFGLVVLFFCALFLTWFVLGFSRRGRMRQFHIQVYARDHFVSIQLLLVSLLYTPAVRNVIVMFNCQSITCPAGTRFPYGESLFTDVAPGSLCEPCNFTQFAQACPASLQDLLCGGPVTDMRLLADSGISCSNITPFFMPAAGIMLVSFVMSLPILNVILTRISARLLEIEYPVDPRQTEGYTEDERWYEKVTLSENVAKFIYAPFQRKFKHWRMFFLTQKLAIVVVSSVARTGTGVAGAPLGIGLSIGIHFLLFLYIAVVSPFQRKAENLFMAVTQIMLSIVGSLGFASAVGAPGPDSLLLVVAVCVFLLPLLALIFGQVITFKDDIEQEAEREERVRIAEQRAEHQEGDADTACLHLTSAADPAKDTELFGSEVLMQPTTSMKRSAAAKGNMNVVQRFEGAPKPPTRDYHGKQTLLELIRTRAREREASAKQRVLLNLLHQSGGAVDDDISAFGAALMNLRGRVALKAKTRNTLEQSARARANWKRAHDAVSKKIKKDQLKRRGTFFGKVGGGQKTSKFEKLLETLLAQARESEDQLAASCRGGAVSPSTVNPFQSADGAKRRQRNQIQFDDQGSQSAAKDEKTGHVGLPTFSRSANSHAGDAKGSGDASTSASLHEDDEVQLVKGAAVARRQHMQVRSKLKHIYDQQLVKLSLTQQAVDFKINKRTINAINIFFVFSGLLAVLAISFCLVGFFDSVDETFYGNFDPNEAGITSQQQFAGYDNWTHFTENCCCVASTNQRPRLPYYAVDVEGWLCQNGNYRERIRSGIARQSSTLIDGFSVRRLCGLSFLNGCSVSVDPVTARTALTGCNASLTTLQKLMW